MKVLGIIGYSGSGKTTLITSLIPELVARGLTVSTIKHAHHGFDIDHPGKDSYRHREAGAREVLIATDKRWALMHEVRDEEAPVLDQLLSKLEPVDLVLVEGYKYEDYPMIEVWDASSNTQPLFPLRRNVIGLVSAEDMDAGKYGRSDLAVFHRDDCNAIAGMIADFAAEDEARIKA